VMCARKRAGKADITPTLVDLERTHILYVNAHFKPFAAIGSSYSVHVCAKTQASGRALMTTITGSSATQSNCGNTLKPFGTTLRRRRTQRNPWETT
jgi:hypothetical protein